MACSHVSCHAAPHHAAPCSAMLLRQVMLFLACTRIHAPCWSMRRRTAVAAALPCRSILQAPCHAGPYPSLPRAHARVSHAMPKRARPIPSLQAWLEVGHQVARLSSHPSIAIWGERTLSDRPHFGAVQWSELELLVCVHSTDMPAQLAPACLRLAAHHPCSPCLPRRRRQQRERGLVWLVCGNAGQPASVRRRLLPPVCGHHSTGQLCPKRLQSGNEPRRGRRGSGADLRLVCLHLSPRGPQPCLHDPLPTPPPPLTPLLAHYLAAGCPAGGPSHTVCGHLSIQRPAQHCALRQAVSTGGQCSSEGSCSSLGSLMLLGAAPASALQSHGRCRTHLFGL